MPSTVSDVFAAADLEPAGVVRWRTPVPESAPGVYIVALTDDLDSTAAARPVAPLARAALEQLLAVRPELRMNLAQPDADDLIERLGGFWPGDEVVLYIGLAGQSLRRRVGQYYKTPLGARRPHAGGWWLKTLAVLDELWVHWAPTPDCAREEKRMLREFSRAVSPASRAALLDDQRVTPFANLRGHDDRIKEHRISGATGDLPGRTAAAAVVPAAPGKGLDRCERDSGPSCETKLRTTEAGCRWEACGVPWVPEFFSAPRCSAYWTSTDASASERCPSSTA
jgi:hypothetical protein